MQHDSRPFWGNKPDISESCGKILALGVDRGKKWNQGMNLVNNLYKQLVLTYFYIHVGFRVSVSITLTCAVISCCDCEIFGFSGLSALMCLNVFLRNPQRMVRQALLTGDFQGDRSKPLARQEWYTVAESSW